MLPFLTTQCIATEYNSMKLISKYSKILGSVLYPESRANMVARAIKQYKIGKANISIKGDAKLIDRIASVFDFFGVKEANTHYEPFTEIYRPGNPWTKRQMNSGSFTLSGGYDQTKGGSVEGQFTISWAKSQAENKGSFTLTGGYDQTKGGSVEGSLDFSWAKRQQMLREQMRASNKVTGSFGITGGYSTTKGAYVSGSLTIKFAHDGIVDTVYIDEVTTPRGIIYLPTHTPGKFDNLISQIIDGQAQLE